MSLRLRVLLAMTLIGIVVVSSSLVTRQLVQRQLVTQLDARLRVAGPLGDPSRGGRNGNPPSSAFRGLPAGFSPYFFAEVDSDGEVDVRTSANLTENELADPTIDVAKVRALAQQPNPKPITVRAKDGSDLEYRLIARSNPRNNSVIVIAAPLNEVKDSLRSIEWVLVVVAVGVLLALAIVAWWVIRLGVRPVKQMAHTASLVAGEDADQPVDLAQRVDVASPGTEVGELGRAMNAMLDRLQHSFDERMRTEQRLRQFVGDASHELRTPVQTIRGYTELYRLGALSDSTKLDDAMRRSEQEAVRMVALVDDLLTLARFDNARPLQREPVDVCMIARDAVANVGAMQPQRDIRLDVSDCGATGTALVIGDENSLRQVFANVIGNALVHTPETSAIDVVVRIRGDEVVVAITDEGPGMTQDLAERAFERFVRADQARTRHAGGSGLGLALVHASVTAHLGTVELQSSTDAGTTVTIVLPLAP